MRCFQLLFLLFVISGTARAEIRVAFPAENQRLPPVDKTYVIGALDRNGAETVYINGATTDVYRTGAFLRMVPVKPGTNTLIVAAGLDRLVRHVVVESPRSTSTKDPVIIDSDESSRLLPPKAWKTIGSLFTNRVRTEIGDGATSHYLPKDFVLCGSEVKGTEWVCVWLENVRGFMPKTVLQMCPKEKVPSKALLVPDVAAGFSERPPYGRPPSSVRICLDPGHGGSDSGALSPHGWREKEVNLLQALAIRTELEKAGFSVVMTREDDSFPSLYSRPQMAYDQRVDAFISVHHNATAANRDPRQVRHTTIYASTSNGLALASCIQKHVAPVMAPVTDSGAQVRSFAVCRNPCVPSCLMEVDFINLPEGEEASWDPDRQKKVAEAVVLGLLDWMTPPKTP